VPPAFSVTCTVFGSVNSASPITSSAPLALNLPRCTSRQLGDHPPLAAGDAGHVHAHRPGHHAEAPGRVHERDGLGAVNDVLAGQATFGQEPPTIARSTTTVFWPQLARVQAMILPATPLPITGF
jgi:hypothetical protein